MITPRYPLVPANDDSDFIPFLPPEKDSPDVSSRQKVSDDREHVSNRKERRMPDAVLQVLGADHYWEDRASVLLRLANAISDRAQRAQLRMYAEQDHAIAAVLRQEARRHQTGGSDDDAEPHAPEPSPP